MEVKTSNNNLSWTGERFIPGVEGSIEMEHLHRYWSVVKLCQGKDVLDIACGEGYGSYTLAQVARSVIGVDVARQAVEHAQQKYKGAGLSFLEGSCQSIPAPPHSFDVVVSFETLEHIVEHEEFMQEIKRVLRSDGLLIISTPDKHIYSDITNYKNEFHVRELYEQQFDQLLKEKFKHVEILWQEVLSGSFLMKEGASEKRSVLLYEQEDKELCQLNRVRKSPYMVALASDHTLPELDESVLVIPPELGNHLLNMNKDLPAALKSVNELKREKIRLEGVLNEKEEIIQRLEQEKSNLQEEKDSLQDKLHFKQGVINRLANERTQISGVPPSAVLPSKIGKSSKQSVQAKRAIQPNEHFSLPTEVKEVHHRIKESGLFDAEFYRAKYPDVQGTDDNALIHFILHGYKERRQPHPLFDPGFYLKKYPQVHDSGQNYLCHFLAHGNSGDFQPHPVFDPSFYLENYPEVQAAGKNPLCHFLAFGGVEERNPHPFFSTSFYLKEYPDVVINPLIHYILYGAAEGRNPSPSFDTNFYVQRYSDVKESGCNPLEHYILHGVAENRRTQPLQQQKEELQKGFFLPLVNPPSTRP